MLIVGVLCIFKVVIVFYMFLMVCSLIYLMLLGSCCWFNKVIYDLFYFIECGSDSVFVMLILIFLLCILFVIEVNV